MSADSKGKILLIEDDSALRSVYADAIAADGYTVVTAEDGEQGLAMVRTEKPMISGLILSTSFRILVISRG